MKIINNQNILLIDELKNSIDNNSNIYISCNHFTSYALYELLETLYGAKKVCILINSLEHVDDFRFIETGESKLNLDLDRKYKINQVLEFLKSKADIRKGGLANQNVIIVE